jgi:hypothetical protein
MVDAAERSLTAAFTRLTWRARVIAAAEAAAWGVAAASVSILAGAAIAVGIGMWRSRRVTRARVVRSVDCASRAANVLVTGDELLENVLHVPAVVRARVIADAAARLPSISMPSVLRTRTIWRAVATAAVCWSIAAAVASNKRLESRIPTPGSRIPIPAHAATAPLRVTAIVRPPEYTGLPQTTVDDPAELHVVEGSAIELRGSRPIKVTHDGDEALDRTFVASRSGSVTVAPNDGGAERLIPVVVSPDALPAVRVTAPGRDLVFADATPRIDFVVRASDDYGLRSLTLQYTKVTGSGEDYTFDAGEIPLTVSRPSEREWAGTATRALAAFGLKDGDMLVYRASASDRKPGERQSTSDAFFIEISRLGVAAGDAFTLPEEETRYALSEQMLIVKTEHLLREGRSLGADALTEASLNLAVEQRRIRAEFVFMLGGEIADEEVEAEQSIELQAGRLANRGQRDLRDATRAMSQAEKLLTGGDPGAALASERAAVQALQRAFARDRYLLRALATRLPLDVARRLSGDRSGTHQTRLPLAPSPENQRIAQLQDLVRGVGELSRDSSLGRPVDRSRVLVLAAAAIRIDPESAALRSVAADVQTGRFDNATALLAAELHRVLADPVPALLSIAPDLARALDAARPEGR